MIRVASSQRRVFNPSPFHWLHELHKPLWVCASLSARWQICGHNWKYRLQVFSRVIDSRREHFIKVRSIAIIKPYWRMCWWITTNSVGLSPGKWMSKSHLKQLIDNLFSLKAISAVICVSLMTTSDIWLTILACGLHVFQLIFVPCFKTHVWKWF